MRHSLTSPYDSPHDPHQTSDPAGPSDCVRTAELAALRELTTAPGAAGRLIAVLGEPGSGKTHLLAALAQSRRWTALPATVHQCSRHGRERAIDAVRALLRGARRAGAARSGDAGPGTVTSMTHRGRPDRELVVLEDVHLADERTIAELADLAAGNPAPLVDVLVSLRPRQAPTELIEAITRGVSFGRTTSLELAPLTDEQTIAMGPVSPSYEARRRAGGNPFNLRALQALEQSTRTGNDSAVAPFEFAVLNETRDLTLNERYVLHAAAILRSRFDVELLAEIAGLDAVVVSAVIPGLTRRDLVRAETGECVFSIRDEVFGTLLRRTIDPCWAARAHKRAVQRLSARGVGATHLGFHLLGSVSKARADELVQIVDGSYEIMETDVSESVSWLTPVIAEAPAATPAGDRARLALSTAFGRIGRMHESRDLLFAVHEAGCTAAPAELAEQIAFVSVVEGVLSEDVQTLDMLTEWIARPDLRGTPAWARLVFARGLRVTMLGRTSEADEVAEALRDALDHGDALTGAGLLALQALDATALRDLDRAAALLDDIGERLDRAPGHQVAQRLESVLVTALANDYLGRYTEARQQLRRGVELARRSQRAYLLPTLLVLLSETERQLGLLSHARDSADAAIIEAISGNSLRHAQAVALRSAAEVWLQPPGSGRARALAQQALAQQSPTRNVNGSACVAAVALAKCSWLEGDPHHCVTLLLNEGKGPGLWSIPVAMRGVAWELMCAAGLDAGLPLDEWAASSEEHARLFPLPHHRAYADLTRGHLARSRSMPAEALECYRDAAGRFGSVGMQIEQCYALGQMARALGDLGRVAEAHGARNLAVDIAQRPKAETMLDWLSRRVPASSAASSAQAESAPGGAADARSTVPTTADIGQLERFGRLTKRERQIALLICSGMKRREIADRLRISMRTVDVHLTRIYRKAGVNSRMELALTMGPVRAVVTGRPTETA
ncbi:LuxR C-terminal-related transcriptional regulator [Actinomadura sp. 9N215]|uniref:helix-turn-helix transcriptional regulator n=1 Tax=Actinomadura sp. 9N215 TaxID=3375150 RepID=UPI0037BA9EDA